MGKILLKNTIAVNEGKQVETDVLIENDLIVRLDSDISDDQAKVIDFKGDLLLPGVIDDQVHFREPGLTHKGNIYIKYGALAHEYLSG